MTPYSLVITATTHVQNVMNSKDAMVLNPVLYPVITPASDIKGLQKAVTDFLHRMLEAYSGFKQLRKYNAVQSSPVPQCKNVPTVGTSYVFKLKVSETPTTPSISLSILWQD